MILCIFLFNKIRKDKEFQKNKIETELTQTEVQTEENSQSLKKEEYKYYILEIEGRISVFETTNHSIFLDTAIKAAYLPDHLREELKEGIYFKTEKDMFDFLESYSS